MSTFPHSALRHSCLVPHSLVRSAPAPDAASFYGEAGPPARPGVIILLGPGAERDSLHAALGGQAPRLDDLSMAAPALLGTLDPIGVLQAGMARGGPLFLCPELLNAFRIGMRPVDRSRLSEFLDAHRIITRADLEHAGAAEALTLEFGTAAPGQQLPPPDRRFGLEELAELVGTDGPEGLSPEWAGERISLVFRSIRGVMDRGTLVLRLECDQPGAVLTVAEGNAEPVRLALASGRASLLVRLPPRGSLPVMATMGHDRDMPFRVLGLEWHADDVLPCCAREHRTGAALGVLLPA